MKFKATFEGDKRPILQDEIDIPSSQAEKKLLEYQITTPFFRGKIMEQFNTELNVHYTSFKSYKNLLIQAEDNTPFFCLTFVLNGSSIFKNAYLDQQIEYNNPLVTLHYIKQGKGWANIMGKQQQEFFELQFPPEIFSALSENISSKVDSFLKKCSNSMAIMDPQFQIAINPEMKSVIDQINHCSFTGKMKEVYYKNKASELLMLYISALENKEQYFSVQNKDKKKIEEAKDFILSNPPNKLLSLKEISLASGLNEFKLKKGFKEIFGTCVSQFMIDRKLQHAYELIINSEMSISEISSLAGYSYPQHFSKAFKKHFGKNPSKLRRGWGFL